jgi:hypothetical protein
MSAEIAKLSENIGANQGVEMVGVRRVLMRGSNCFGRTAYCNQPRTAGISSRDFPEAMAVIAPQSEWPQMTMSVTPIPATAYSMVAETPPGCGP